MARRRLKGKGLSSRGKKTHTRGARKSKGILLLWAMALLIVGGGVGYWFFRDRDEKRPPPQPTVPEVASRIKLYFGDDQGDHLVPELREVHQSALNASLASIVVKELIKGPRGDLQPTIPPGVELRGEVNCEKGICTVDLSSEAISNHPGGTSAELLTVYSIVESLRENIPGMRATRFLVEGRPVETLAGHISLNEPVAANPALIKIP